MPRPNGVIKWDENRVPKKAGTRSKKFLAITKGNIKLGFDVWKFSLPVNEHACPGRTTWCAAHCYAKDGWYKRTLIKGIRNDNWTLAQNYDALVDAVTHDLKKAKVQLFRIHDSGDFFNVPYILAWGRIIDAHPQIKFWTMTHSWTRPELLPALEQLRTRPNLQLFASVDPATPTPPQGWRIAAMHGIVPGVVCLFQTGHKANCADCGFCFKPDTRNVVWLYHGHHKDALTQPTLQLTNT